MLGHHFSSRPLVIQGNFQGRTPSFALQPRAGAFASGQRAPHVQTALQRNVNPNHRQAAFHQQPVTQPRHVGNAFELPKTFQFKPSVMGRPLPSAVQQKMEAFFKANFSDVRIHEGPQAQQVGALAFTMGSDIYFAPGHYRPNSSHGQRLLGHELTHVVQQRSGRVHNPFGAGVAVVQDPGLEAEAERLGWLASEATGPSSPGHSRGAPVVQPMALSTFLALAAVTAYVVDWAFGSPVQKWFYKKIHGTPNKQRLIIGCGHARDEKEAKNHPRHEADQNLMDIDPAMRPDVVADITKDIDWYFEEGTYVEVFFENVPCTIFMGNEVRNTMQNAAKLLKKGGVVRWSTGCPPSYTQELISSLRDNLQAAGFREIKPQIESDGLTGSAVKG